MPDNYVIGSGLTDQQLQAASWWAQHKISLRKIGYGALIAIGGALWLFTLWTVLDTYVISASREHQIIPRMAGNVLAPGAYDVPQSIQVGDTIVFPTTGDRNDFLVQIGNPNPQWWADLIYHFTADTGESTPSRHGFILPASQRYVTEIGWTAPSSSDGIAQTGQFQVDSVAWHRVDPADVERDEAAFLAKRFQLSFASTTYAHDLKIDNHTVGQTSFVLQNPSGFGFWNADLTVILSKADTPVAVTTITIKDIKPGEVRPITINWFDNLQNISKTDVSASVNVLDPNAYLPSDRF